MSLTEPAEALYQLSDNRLWVEMNRFLSALKILRNELKMLGRIRKDEQLVDTVSDGENQKEEVPLSSVSPRRGGGTMRMQDARDAVTWVTLDIVLGWEFFLLLGIA